MDHYTTVMDGVAHLVAHSADYLDTVPFDECTEAVMLQNATTMDCLALRVVLAKGRLHTFSRMVEQMRISPYCMPKHVSVDTREQTELCRREVMVSTERVSASKLYIQLASTRVCSGAALHALYRIASQENDPIVAKAFETIAPVWNLMLHKNYCAAIALADLHYDDSAHPCHADAMNAKIAAIALTGQLEEFLRRHIGVDQADALEQWRSAYAIAARVCDQLNRERQANPCPWRSTSA